MEFEQLYQALAGFGWQGLLIVAVILFGVAIAKKAGVVATGNQARLASILLGAIFTGLGENPNSEGALMAVLSVTLAGLAHTGLEWVGNKYPSLKWLVNLLELNKPKKAEAK